MASTFEVTVRHIERIWPHPSADRLELGSVGGLAFQFCLQKGLYTVGQKVIYFPVDSLLPQWIIDKLELWGKDENGHVIRDEAGRVVKTMLVGDAQNRIHTVQLRGEISQGMVCPAEELLRGFLTIDTETTGQPITVSETEFHDGDNVAVLLGVTKYDAPESILKGAKLLSFPDGVTTYDIEGADNYLEVVKLLMDIPVCVMEKLEGTCHAYARLPEGRNIVCARNNEVAELPLNELDENGNPPPRYPGWEAVRRQKWEDLLLTIPVPEFPLMPVAIRGELIGPGVPKSFYPLKVPEIRCFDIKVGPNYLDVEDWIHIVPEGQRVPIMAVNITLREWLAGRTLAEASDGKSVLAPDRLREGVVIKPMKEQKIPWPNGSIKRLIIKQRSPKYLAKEKV